MGHPLNVTDNSDFTPLHEASNFGHLEYVEELHRAGANLNMQSRDKVTPLITAAANGHVAVMEYLINAGARVQASDQSVQGPDVITPRRSTFFTSSIVV